jgi:RNA polymerase-interacting CarD/CdnL/TRCF family regulator
MYQTGDLVSYPNAGIGVITSINTTDDKTFYTINFKSTGLNIITSYSNKNNKFRKVIDPNTANSIINVINQAKNPDHQVNLRLRRRNVKRVKDIVNNNDLNKITELFIQYSFLLKKRQKESVINAHYIMEYNLLNNLLTEELSVALNQNRLDIESQIRI